MLFAIPMSLLGTIAVLFFLGWTLNTFTLLALSLAVGLVVDDAVMVMENIFRHAEMGKSGRGERGHQGKRCPPRSPATRCSPSSRLALSRS